MNCAYTSVNLVSRATFQVPYDEMNRTQQIAVAIGIICVIGAVLAIFISAGLDGAYPVAGNFLSCTGLGLVATSIALYFILRRNTADIRQQLSPPSLNRAPPIVLQVVKSEIKQLPVEHLDTLTPAIMGHAATHSAPGLRVTFLGQPGVDDGGLSKDYLDDLFQGLIQCERLCFQTVESSSLAVPLAQPESVDMKNVYQQMGMVIMWCTPTMHIGSHLDPSVFFVAFNLTAEEIDNSFEVLSFERRLELYRHLLTAQNDHTHDELFTLLENTSWKEEEIQAAATRACYTNCLPVDLMLSDVPNMPIIRESVDNQNRVREGLIEFAQVFLNPQLRGIHALAGGMHSICILRDSEMWVEYDPLEFSARLQGSLDKNKIADRIRYGGDNDEILTKMGWLKEWIREDASDLEVRQVVKYITGSTGLGETEYIQVISQDRSSAVPFPKAHSCDNQLELAPVPSSYETENDYSKVNFIKCFKLVALGEAANYTIV